MKLDLTKSKSKRYLKNVICFIILYFIWWFTLFYIGAFVETIPCYSEFQNSWFSCNVNGYTFSKTGLIYFNNTYTQFLYRIFYNTILPSLLSVLSFLLFSRLRRYYGG